MRRNSETTMKHGNTIVGQQLLRASLSAAAARAMEGDTWKAKLSEARKTGKLNLAYVARARKARGRLP